MADVIKALLQPTLIFGVTRYTVLKYRICSNKSRAQIEAGARIEAGCELSVSLIEAGARIEAGFEYTPRVLLQYDEGSFPL